MAQKFSSVAFIVSFGAEDYFLDQDIARARKWKDRQVFQVSGEDVDDREVVSLCETGSMDGAGRVIILDDAHKVKGDKALRAYIAEKDPKDDHVVLLAVLRTEKCPELWNQAAKKGRLIEHKKLKTWDSNNEVVKWVALEARKLDLTLDTGIAQLLYQLVGSNLYRLANELHKLAVLLGPQGKVGIEQVRLVVAASPTAEPFQVADAAFAKDSKKAMNTLSTVYRLMGDDAHVPITYSLIKQVEKFVLARAMLDKKASEEDIASALSMHPWRCKTQFLPLVQQHSMPALLGYMIRLRRLDVDVKSSAKSKRTLVEITVLSIAS